MSMKDEMMEPTRTIEIQGHTVAEYPSRSNRPLVYVDGKMTSDSWADACSKIERGEVVPEEADASAMCRVMSAVL